MNLPDNIKFTYPGELPDTALEKVHMLDPNINFIKAFMQGKANQNISPTQLFEVHNIVSAIENGDEVNLEIPRIRLSLDKEGRLKLNFQGNISTVSAFTELGYKVPVIIDIKNQEEKAAIIDKMAGFLSEAGSESLNYSEHDTEPTSFLNNTEANKVWVLDNTDNILPFFQANYGKHAGRSILSYFIGTKELPSDELAKKTVDSFDEKPTKKQKNAAKALVAESFYSHIKGIDECAAKTITNLWFLTDGSTNYHDIIVGSIISKSAAEAVASSQDTEISKTNP